MLASYAYKRLNWLLFLLPMLGTDFANIIELPANRANGGILVAWRNSLGTTGASQIDEHSVSVWFILLGRRALWLTCVHGPQGNDNKLQFLQELGDGRAGCPGPWMTVGYLKLIYKAEHMNNNNYSRAMMHHFRRLIGDLALKDIPLHGRKFTWSSQQANPMLVRLDTVLCTMH
jgi:hypothetical protein